MNTLIIFGAKFLVYILVAVAVGWVLKQDRGRQREILIFAIIVLPLSYIFAKIGSFLYYDPRPFVAQNFTPLIPHAADNGFPSDHTLLAGAIAAAIFPFNKKIGIVLFVLALIIGVARVFAGVHHLVDIFGSLVIPSTVAYVVYHWLASRGSMSSRT